MHRVDASGHVANMFSPGDPANGIVPTQLDHEWHNAVQENICQLIEGAGIALVKGDHTQLMDAVAAMITTAQLTAAQILARLITVDGAGTTLDADTVDGLHAAAFVLASNYTAADVLAKLLTVDGPGSGLNAELFNGQAAAYYTNIIARLGYTPVNKAADTITGLLSFLTNNNAAIASRPSGSTGPEVIGNGTGPALMTFHRPSSFAAFLGLDTDNKLKWGGWSLGAVAHEIWHAGLATSGTSSNGYWRQLPDGTIEQWCVGVGAAGGEAPETITFPIAFPTEVLGLIVSTQLAGASTASDVWYQNLAPGLTGVTVQRQKASGGSDGVTTIPRVYAIGR